MADPTTGLPTVAPSGSVPDVYQRLRPPSDVPVPQFRAPVMPGGALGAGMEQLGAGLRQAGTFFGQVAADDAFNQYQEGVNKILRGDPSKTGPNGEPDVGYLGLKGRAAMDARADTEKAMEKLRKELRGNMLTPQQQFQFDGYARRFKSFADQSIGTHADRETNNWYSQVETTKSKLALERAAANADDPTQLLESLDELIASRVRMAQRSGGGPEAVLYAEQSARRDVLSAQVSAIAINDPVRAMRILEKNRAVAGTQYDELANKFRTRAEQQTGRDRADMVLGAGAPPPAGEDTHAVLRHFEGFRSEPYWDKNHWRVGYGSDTITRPDGRVVEVTKDTMVTREDAERDLRRRAAESQDQVRKLIGDEAWDRLTPQAKASVTSVVYNYGSLPGRLLKPLSEGDSQAIAQAIRALGADNEGINARRRASEAANIAPVLGPDGKPAILSQNEAIQQVMADPELRDKPQAQAAAITRIHQSYALRQDTEVRQRAAFEVQVKDSVAEAHQLGATVNPVPESDFVRHYGVSQGPAKYQEYASNITFAADAKAMQSMSDVEMEQFINARTPGAPQPGVPGYSYKVANFERLQKYAISLQKERRDDPAGVVSRMPAVQRAFATYDEKNPATFNLVAAARMQAQAELGIEDEFRTPITKAEALKLTSPLATAIPGREIETLVGIAQKFRTMFGDNAARAMAYAVRARHVDARVAEDAGNLINKLTRGEGLTRAEQQQFNENRAEAAERRAVPPEPSPPWSTFGFDAPAAMTMGRREPPAEGPKFPTPSSQAIGDLFKGDISDKQFDTLYGPGAAAKLQQQFPMMFQNKPK